MNFVPSIALFSIAPIVDDVVGGAFQMLKDSCASVCGIICGNAGGLSGSNALAATTMSGVTGNVIGIVKSSIIPSLEGVGLAIAVLFFIIALIELVNQDRLTMEIFIKFFSKLAIAVFAVTICDEIFDYSVRFGDALATQLANVFSSVSFTVPASLGEQINNQYPGTFDKIGAIISLLITMFPCYILSFAIQIIVYIISFSRLIELCARGCFLPIATGLLADDGWRGAGGRYIKKFIAICAQSAMLVVVAGIAGMIMSIIGQATIANVMTGTIKFGTLASGMGLMCGIGIAMVATMFKCSGIINDVFGA